MNQKLTLTLFALSMLSLGGSVGHTYAVRAQQRTVVTHTTRPAARIEKELRPVVEFDYKGHRYLQFGLAPGSPITHAGTCTGFHYAGHY